MNNYLLHGWAIVASFSFFYWLFVAFTDDNVKSKLTTRKDGIQMLLIIVVISIFPLIPITTYILEKIKERKK